MKNEEELTLRDKFAIEIMNALLIGKSGQYDVASIAADADEYTEAAYKIADAMRKARLTAFT